MMTEQMSVKIAALPSLRLTVEAHGLMAKKALGQNFLLDQNITDKIINLSLQKQNKKDFSGANVFEVGPGPGGLTRAVLAAEPKSLTVVEMDERCIAIMNEIKEKTGDILHIINGDAMQTDFSVLAPAPRHIISNLPYNISVPLLVGWLKNINAYDSLTLMFQKEVAERITAPIKTKDYGRISVLSQLQCRIDHLLFHPGSENLVIRVAFSAAGKHADRRTNRQSRKTDNTGLWTTPQNDSPKPEKHCRLGRKMRPFEHSPHCPCRRTNSSTISRTC